MGHRQELEPCTSRKLLTLAVPLVLSQGFMTIQVTVDRILLAHHEPREVAAAFPAMMVFWLPFGLLQGTVGYVATFVAQYWGAGRPLRVGIAVWHGLYAAIGLGLIFALLAPAWEWLIWWGRPREDVAALELTYLRYLSWAACPMLLVAAVNSFFSGLGRTWTILLIDGTGTLVNIVAGWLLIFGYAGLPEMGIAGAGLSTVVGAWVSASTGLVLLWRRQERQTYGTGQWCYLERELTLRLFRYGVPAGIQMFLDVLAFTLFTLLVGRLGVAAMTATSIAVTLNMLAFLPMIGVGQAVGILVGQYVGADQPEQAEQATWLGLRWVFGYMVAIAAVYVGMPEVLIAAFAPTGETERAAFVQAAVLVPPLLQCVAVYSLADAANVTFAFALRGAGDTRFVSWLTFAMAWPVMVLPTWYIVEHAEQWSQRWGQPLFAAWGCATAYIVLMAGCLWWRFRTGLWKTMRVIEPDNRRV
ncbi:MAG: MATE family efflux transporter [Gemmataceae bacterium]|nr:MATE family efflux transporter [Gemmataceae bacterium]